ncbi:MAG: hypothetical protein MRY83_15835 [Flavobacteriales bacterium]|nr:hypothetical protein [Flavobacteriales bacterium]
MRSLLFGAILLVGCVKTPKFELRDTNGSAILALTTKQGTDAWPLPYPTYQFQVGDINNDGLDDALVGVIKKTRYDSSMSKRLFIFKNYKGKVRPLWLGSRLSYPLVDFKVLKNKGETRLLSLEQSSESKFLVSEYKWYKFGLSFEKHLVKDLSWEEANQTFDSYED